MSEEKKGKGRPRKKDTIKNDKVSHNETEQGVNQNTEEEVSDIPEENTNDVVNSVSSDIPDNDDDLKSFIKKDNKVKNNETDNDIDDAIDQEIQDFEKQEGLNDIPDDNYNPLKDAVKQRAYTDGGMGLKPDENVVYTQEQGQGKGQEKVISEPNYMGGGHSKKPDIDATLINPTNSGGDGVLDIPDDNYYNQQQQTKKPNSNTSNNSGASGGQNTQKSETKESNLKDLSPKEKREEVEKTADAVLLAYRNYVPLVLNYFASHDVKKLKDLEKKGQIDLESPMNRKGDTILDYIKEFNKEVEEEFRITDAEIEAIKPALVDVLMEKEIAFTPTQKLIFVLGQFLVAKIMLLIKFIRRKNADIKEFKKMHLEVLEKADEIRLQNETIRKQNEDILNEMRRNNGTQQPQAQTQNQTQQYQTQQPQPQPQQSTPQPQQQNNDTTNSNLTIVKEESTQKDTTIVNETDVEEKEPTLDDALNIDTTTDVSNEGKENDIPN